MPTLELARVRLKRSSSSPNPTPTAPQTTPTLPPHLLPTWRTATSLASTAAGSRFALYGAVPHHSPPPPSSTPPPSLPPPPTSSLPSLATPHPNDPAATTQGAQPDKTFFMVGIWRDEAEHVRFLASAEAKAMAGEIGREAEVVGVRFVALRGEVAAGLVVGGVEGEGEPVVVVRVWRVQRAEVDGWEGVRAEVAGAKAREGDTSGVVVLRGWDVAREVLRAGKEVFREVQRLTDSAKEAFAVQEGQDRAEEDGAREWVEVTVGEERRGGGHRDDQGAFEKWVLRHIV